MRAPARLALYGLILVAVFAAAGFTANAVISEDTVQAWVEETPEGHGAGHGEEDMNSGGHEGHEPTLHRWVSAWPPAGTNSPA